MRRGNDNKKVRIFRYVTKGTFDAYNWGLVENKQKCADDKIYHHHCGERGDSDL